MAKPPSWNDIRVRSSEFAARWADEMDENAGAQSFWTEFLAIFGIDRKRVATFEARTKRSSTGGRGRIDLFWPGVLVAEHKSAHWDLARAEEQALDYLDAIASEKFPGVIITSNFHHMRILDLGGDAISYEFALTDLVKEIDRFGFLAGYSKRNLSHQHQADADIQAAKLMGRLYEEVSRNGLGDHDASILLTRLLFLLFGDDTGMWEASLFDEFIQTRTSEDGSDLGPQLALLFQVLDKPETSRSSALDDLLLRFPYVNGGLFRDRLDIPIFDRAMRIELLACGAFEWGSISPAIFGSMFQAIKSQEARRELGEHYTTEGNILRLIEPLYLDELWEEFNAVKNSAKKLEGLRTRLGELKFLDPACGCGNFLLISYRELRALELQILKRLRDLSGDRTLMLDATAKLKVSLSQFYGIEIEDWPAQIAETAMFLADHQANLELASEFGLAPDRLPIQVESTIIHGNALRLDWHKLVEPDDNLIILGNPPFIGSRMQTNEQREDQDLVWGDNKRHGTMDYVTNWFHKAAEFSEHTRARIAFVSTNSITQGEQPAVLWTELWSRGFGIDFAHRTFAWSSEAPGAASVHVVIIGFSKRLKRTKRRLWLYETAKSEGHEIEANGISPYLIEGPDVVISSRQNPLVEGVPPLNFGSMPRDGGHLAKISPAEAHEIQAIDPIASRYLHRLIGGEELIDGIERWCLWLVDASPKDLLDSSVLKERLREVRKMRLESKATSTIAAASTPGLFVQRTQPITRYLAVPRVSSETRNYLPTAFFDPDMIASDLVFTISGADPYLFGIISSRVFMAWNRTISGRLESRLRVSQEITYNNFPWLSLDHPDRESIATAANLVLSTRKKFPDLSLSVLYNPVSMPPVLVEAHRNLDRVVLKAYGLKSNDSESTILSYLLVRYLELASAGELPGLFPKKIKTRRKSKT